MSLLSKLVSLNHEEKNSQGTSVEKPGRAGLEGDNFEKFDLESIEPKCLALIAAM